MARKTKRITTIPGYVKYLRTSDEDVQAPERSQDGQRRDIDRLLIFYQDVPDSGEYVDNYTGTSADRKNYQQMLRNARQGKFSHVFSATPDRFGRNDVEALRAIDELTALGLCVRFASHPDLEPANEDDRLYLNILFGMARRESRVTARRSKNGMLSKLLRGGWPWRAPDGYVNKETKLTEAMKEDHLKHTRYRRWVELDPEQGKLWRYAWDLLLEDSLTLDEICEKL
jgi:DNA invertase Pin-like site-specific DNA recombinase